MSTFKAWINPLKCPEIDMAEPGAATPKANRLFDYLFAPEGDRSADAFVERYKEIAAVDDSLPIAPAESNILDKLVWPLRHAKGNYALGNYLGCIALCGMVGEMVAILLWEMSKVTLHGKLMAAADEKAIFGHAFEKLGQERRIKVLHALELIDADMERAFDSLREIRRKYLHFFSQTHAQVAPDAQQAFKDAIKVVSVVLGQTFKDGAVVLRPDLMAYLTKRGIITVEDKNDDS